MVKWQGTMESVGIMNLENFYNGKKVFLTGHTGFKGTWMTKLLIMLGAKVTGYALKPGGNINLYELVELNNNSDVKCIIGDIRDLDSLYQAVLQTEPDVMLHLAAQPIVRESYEKPVYTYETNVMGTVNFMECVRNCNSVRSIINVTTDKVYKNKEWFWGYRETDSLDGYDPYSNSKSCSELITSSYKNSFFKDKNVAISTCRAGNVIGGGDFAKDRIIPDCIRSAINKETIIVRNPDSIRPYQHVLEPVTAYLTLAAMQYEKKDLQGCYNIGPEECDCVTTGELVDLFCNTWENINWRSQCEIDSPHEAAYLKLDNSKIKKLLKWKPTWNIAEAIEKTVDWSKAFYTDGDIKQIMENQINEFLRRKNNE